MVLIVLCFVVELFLICVFIISKVWVTEWSPIGKKLHTRLTTCFHSISILVLRFSEDFFCEMPKKFSKSHVPGTEMTFIAVEKLVSTGVIQ